MKTIIFFEDTPWSSEKKQFYAELGGTTCRGSSKISFQDALGNLMMAEQEVMEIRVEFRSNDES